MPSRRANGRHPGSVAADRLGPRLVCVGVTALFIVTGLLYDFRWGSVVRHTPSLWISPPDLSGIYTSASAVAHGHFGAIYQSQTAVLTFPGILFLLAPLGALSGHLHTVFVQITENHHPLTYPHYLLSHTPRIWDTGTIASGAHGANEYAVQPQWFAVVAPVVIILSCVVLFACDVLAERLKIPPGRRAVLVAAEAVVLWPVVVIWGHPEDALALALAVFALFAAMEDRWGWAGWLFGAAVAVQPLVVVVFPILLVMGGKDRAIGLVVRGVGPAAAVTVGPLVGDAHATIHNVVTQPAYPNIAGTHQTPWTFLAPKLGGKGATATVGGGPVRATTLALAVALGVWARRWRARPEMLVWAAACALALRTYTESVMTAYYVWPALAVGLIVAARGSTWRFAVAIALAVGTTIMAHQHLDVYPWWIVQVVGVTGLLVAASRPEPLPPDATRGRAAPRASETPARRKPARAPAGARDNRPPKASTRRRSVRR